MVVGFVIILATIIVFAALWRRAVRHFTCRYYANAYDPIRLAPEDVTASPSAYHLNDVP